MKLSIFPGVFLPESQINRQIYADLAVWESVRTLRYRMSIATSPNKSCFEQFFNIGLRLNRATF